MFKKKLIENLIKLKEIYFLDIYFKLFFVFNISLN